MATREFSKAAHWSPSPAERQRTPAEIGDKVDGQKQIVHKFMARSDEDSQPVHQAFTGA
jgi:hypothetical protein